VANFSDSHGIQQDRTRYYLNNHNSNRPQSNLRIQKDSKAKVVVVPSAIARVILGKYKCDKSEFAPKFGKSQVDVEGRKVKIITESHV
jgi:hypothetical protein